MKILWFSFLPFLTLIHAFYTSNDAIKVLTPSNFDKFIKFSGVTMVEFFAPWCGHCKNLIPEYRRVGSILKGFARIGAIDTDQYKEYGSKYQIQGFPTIKLFLNEGKRVIDYNGPREAKEMVKFIMKHVRMTVKERLEGKKEETKSKSKPKTKAKAKKTDTEVVELTDSNFNDLVLNSKDLWLVEFYAPWCGHCKKLAPEWLTAANELKGVVKLGAIDATVHKSKAQEYQIQGFPTIKIFKPLTKTASEAMEYQGPRENPGIVQYALKLAEQYGKEPEVVEITSQATLEEHCMMNSQAMRICILAFLPHLSESGAQRRNTYITTLKETMKKTMGQPFSYGWIQAMDQSEYEKQFGLTFGFPSILALNLKKQRYVVMKGALTVKSLRTFTREILSGKEKTLPYDSLPTFQTVSPWNGEEYVAEKAENEEEMDEIMKEMLKERQEKEEL